jgi:hypothetical protein
VTTTPRLRAKLEAEPVGDEVVAVPGTGTGHEAEPVGDEVVTVPGTGTGL